MSSGIENQPRASEHNVFIPQFAREAAVHGILHTPEVIQLHNLCIVTPYENEISYQQRLLALLHACDIATQNHLDDTALRGIAYCLADVHYQTKHYEYCLGELKFIQQNLVRIGSELGLTEVNEAIEHIYILMDPNASLDSSPVRTDILCN